MKKRQATYHWNNEQKKKCPVCKEWFPRPKGKSDKVWEAQECCGRDCANINRRKPEHEITGHEGIKRRKELTPGSNRYLGWTKGKKIKRTKGNWATFCNATSN